MGDYGTSYGGGGDYGTSYGGGDGGYGDSSHGGGYDAGAAGGYNAGGYSAGSPRSETKSPGNRQNKHNVYNLTIRQILTANRVPEEQFYEVDGQTVSSVAFVGEVTHVDPKATAVVFTVEDTTGKMTCKKWNNSSNANSGEIDAGAESDPNIVVGRIVRVHGNLKSFNDQPQLSVYAVKDLNNDANAITHHHLQSVYEHLQRTKGPLGRAGPGGAGVNTPAKGIYGQGPGNVVVKQQTGPAVTSGDVGDLRSAIMTYINRVGADAGDEGVSIDAVQQNVAAARSLPKSKVADELQALCDDGALYTTVDDSHFASTE